MLEERFYSLGRYLKNMFDERVHRISVQLGAAPEGEAAVYALCAGGTIAAPAAENGSAPVAGQMHNAKERVRQRFKFGKFMVHLHSSAGVLTSMAAIEKAVDEITLDNEVIGITITVRPEYLTDEMVAFLTKTSRRICTWLEVGLHTVNDETLRRIGLNHTGAQAKDSLLRLMNTRAHIAPHVVFGLPGETPEMMRRTIREVARLNIEGINIHNMYVLKNTPLEQEYASGALKLPERAEYIGLVCDFIEYLPPSVVLHGLVGTAPEDRLLAPDWTLLRKENLDMIIAELERRGSVQGCKLTELYEVPLPAANG
ncbi:MAG: TIGR01212 family radical SAM protein [Nitrospinae bacterium]|nr:TIGR01212 family radical SAM protein [Nitrospinota bacterium]